MNYYQDGEDFFASLLPDLPLRRAEAPEEGRDVTFLFSRPPEACRAAFCPSDVRQLTAPSEDAAFLDPARLPEGPAFPPELLRRIGARTLRAVNVRHPAWRELAKQEPEPRRRRVHLLAVGDVGGTLLTGLKLLGGECISTIGICDLNERTVDRWTAEMAQVSWPWDYDALPKVEAVPRERLFECDVLLFAAARGIPEVGSAVKDVRMAQFAVNRPLAESCGVQAREAGFRGTLCILSDPVDPLCRSAYLASNRNAEGVWDGRGLRPEQIRGLGLGVMNARAADLARRERRFSAFLDEGRSFGPHGEGLVIANSIEHYDDALSRELTAEVLSANRRIRELGFKPFVAPALSSGAFQLLLMLRGQWHCGSVCLGGVWLGCRSRLTPAGLETEALALPEELFARLRQAEATLAAIE